jgi:hypothetical protein
VCRRTFCTNFFCVAGSAGACCTVLCNIGAFDDGLTGLCETRRSLSASNCGQSRTRCFIDLRPWPQEHIPGTLRGPRSFAKLELLLLFASFDGPALVCPLWKLPPPLDKTGDWIARLETVLIGEYCTGWKVWKEVMSWCWGKEVTKLDSWSGLRGSDPVIDRRIVAELMTNVMIRGVKKREAQVHQISRSEALKLTWAAVLTSCLSILAKWRGTPVQLKKRTPKGTYPEILSAITHSMKPCSCGISLMLRILDVKEGG